MADSTETPKPRDPNDTSMSTNDFPALNFRCYNRKVSRYAKKYKITCEEAFKRLYK